MFCILKNNSIFAAGFERLLLPLEKPLFHPNFFIRKKKVPIYFIYFL